MALADTGKKADFREPINNQDLTALFGASNTVIFRNEAGTQILLMLDSGTPAAADLPLAPKGSFLFTTSGKIFLNNASGDWVELTQFDKDGRIQVPNFATGSLPSAVNKGALAFDSTTNKLQIHNGTAYEVVTSA